MRQTRFFPVAIALGITACGNSVDTVQVNAGGGSSTGSTGPGGQGGATTGSGAGGGPDACDPSEAKTCTGAGQCVLASPDCCLCGMPELSDFVAVNASHAAQCMCQGPICECATALNPNLAASCEGGACVGWDVRTSPYSACNTSSDCRLRVGLGCCESCDGADWNVVAVNVGSEADLRAALCPPNQACDKCAPLYPPNAATACVSGHCAVIIAD